MFRELKVIVVNKVNVVRKETRAFKVTIRMVTIRMFFIKYHECILQRLNLPAGKVQLAT